MSPPSAKAFSRTKTPGNGEGASIEKQNLCGPDEILIGGVLLLVSTRVADCKRKQVLYPRIDRNHGISYGQVMIEVKLSLNRFVWT